MDSTKKKNYIKGSIKEVKVGEGTKLICSLSVEDLQKIANPKGYAAFVIQARKEVDQYGNSHYAFENDFKPDASKKKIATKTVESELKAPDFKETGDTTDELPF